MRTETDLQWDVKRRREAKARGEETEEKDDEKE